MSDGYQRSLGRRVTDTTDLVTENERLRATIVSLEKMLVVEQALRRGKEHELAIAHRRAGQVIDIDFDKQA